MIFLQAKETSLDLSGSSAASETMSTDSQVLNHAHNIKGNCENIIKIERCLGTVVDIRLAVAGTPVLYQGFTLSTLSS